MRNSDITDPQEREQYIIDPGPRTLNEPDKCAHFSRDSDSNGYKMTFPPDNLKLHSIDTLGSIHTDCKEGLTVLGGFGNAGSKYDPPGTVDYANNDGWWDDASDGPVSANVELDTGEVIEVIPAWVLVTPPAYAPQILNLVTLYDTIFDMAVRKMGVRPDIYNNELWNSDYQPNFETDIKPVLEKAASCPWVVAIPPKPHHFNYKVLGDINPKYNAVRQILS